jgi:hypothetical protein
MKSLKTHIIKLLAVTIGMIYLLMPMHKEVKHVLHSLSHSIENLSLVHHDHDHHHEDVKSKVSEASVSHHEHKIINLLDYLTTAKNHHKESKNSKTLDVEFDKHFHSSKHTLLKLENIDNPLVKTRYKVSIKDGFYSKIEIPPKQT